MDKNPKISIVLPTYNGANFLRQSIESCLTQTFKDFELIIVDDGSTDWTPSIVKSYGDGRIVYFRQEHNQGHIAALNKGFAQSCGEFLTWTSDDNFYAPQALESMLKELQDNPGIDFVYSAYQVVDESGEPTRLGRVEGPQRLDEDNCVGGCFLYRRKVYETVGDFNPEAFLAEDYEYWLRVRRQFTMKKMSPVLYFYRMHGQSLTGTHKEGKVQAQVQKIREQFIPEWKKYYLRGKQHYHDHKRTEAVHNLSQAIVRNPFCVPAWRLLVKNMIKV